MEQKFNISNDASEDIEAFIKKLYLSHNKLIFSYIYRITGDKRQANEITQKTFSAALIKYEEIKASRTRAGWLLQVAISILNKTEEFNL